MNIERLRILRASIRKYRNVKVILNSWGFAKSRKDFAIDGNCRVCPAGFACLLPEFHEQGLTFRTVSGAHPTWLVLLPQYNGEEGTQAILDFFDMTLDEFYSVFMPAVYEFMASNNDTSQHRLISRFEEIVDKILSTNYVNAPMLPESKELCDAESRL